MPPRYAQSPDDFPTLAQLRGMSGLEFMQALAEGRLPTATIAGLMNYAVSAVEPGRVTVTGAPEFGHSNAFGGVHGGWYGTVLDTCMACAVMTMLPRGQYYTTLEYRVNILRPVPLGMQILGLGEAQHVGRSTGVARGEIRGAEDGKLYAAGSTTCLVMGQPD